MRWKWQVDDSLDDIEQLPWPLALVFGSNYVLATIRDVVGFFFVLGVAVACLVIGTNLAHYIGAILLAGCVLIGIRFLHRHTARDS